eukprot:5087258-Pleurochrysis_carterae.AAC.3
MAVSAYYPLCNQHLRITAHSCSSIAKAAEIVEQEPQLSRQTSQDRPPNVRKSAHATWPMQRQNAQAPSNVPSLATRRTSLRRRCGLQRGLWNTHARKAERICRQGTSRLAMSECHEDASATR